MLGASHTWFRVPSAHGSAILTPIDGSFFVPGTSAHARRPA